MNNSESINELATALAKAHLVIRSVEKDGDNTFLKTKYATLQSVLAACKQPLADQGISVVQLPEISETGGIGLETILLHSSGQWIRSRFVMPVVKIDAQSVGSAITYARRYAVMAMVNLSAGEDDDGHSATHEIGEVKTKGKVLTSVKTVPDLSAEITRLKKCSSLHDLKVEFHKLPKSMQSQLMENNAEIRTRMLSNIDDVPQ